MRQGSKLDIVSYTSHNCHFLSLCEEVEVAVGGLKTRHPIFVVEAYDHAYVIGQLFLKSAKFSQVYKPDRIFDTITHSHMHQTAIFRTSATQDLANQRENQILPQSLNQMDGVYGVHGLLLFLLSKFGMVFNNFVPKRCLRLFIFGFLRNNNKIIIIGQTS